MTLGCQMVTLKKRGVLIGHPIKSLYLFLEFSRSFTEKWS